MEEIIPTEEDFNNINTIIEEMENEQTVPVSQVIEMTEIIQEVEHLDDLNNIIED